MKFKDYYETCGVPRSATQDEIKRAYRKLARKYHPDVSKDPEAETRFKELGEAYAVLKDPEKRASYDQFGHQSTNRQANWQTDWKMPPGWDAEDAEHIFSTFGIPGSQFFRQFKETDRKSV